MIARPLHLCGRFRYWHRMRIVLTKGVREDHVAITRADGSQAAFDFPKKGPVPHVAFHYFVESGLGLGQGFWGLVAGGMDPEAVGAMAAAAGHASAKRARVPDASIVELLQAERLVECFEAESWSGANDNDGIRAMARAGWEASHVAPLELAGEVLDAIRQALSAFSERWRALATGASLQLDWTEECG